MSQQDHCLVLWNLCAKPQLQAQQGTLSRHLIKSCEAWHQLLPKVCLGQLVSALDSACSIQAQSMYEYLKHMICLKKRQLSGGWKGKASSQGLVPTAGARQVAWHGQWEQPRRRHEAAASSITGSAQCGCIGAVQPHTAAHL